MASDKRERGGFYNIEQVEDTNDESSEPDGWVVDVEARDESVQMKREWRGSMFSTQGEAPSRMAELT
jgi:hypothetical protein